ncbi:MOSC domain-containing protein [Aquabacterium sp. A08]|uniref:MOSC domain-containing protein n=1 Tax=Aquabacterium sp. A08 TaxID=2718532 RepID=UPI001422365C|nr:MOSC N-terminal beta barrel domain-containing protein [Aquabacterium sp. A08]NIC42980.1 MOSC domain-containing protein [Aquabacterium sp. A08]
MAFSDDPLPLTVEQLWTYPVKSCAGLRLHSVPLLETGLEWDRTWMLVDATGEFVSQRELPRMALIRPRFHLGRLELQAPGMRVLPLPLDAAGHPRRVRVWDDEVDAYDMGDLAAQWFTECLAPGAPHGLQAGLRLVRFDPDVRRLSAPAWTGGVEAPNQFSDGFPLLVLSSASLAEANERLALLGLPPLGPERFRPNLVLGGLAAHDEDRLADIHLHAQLPDGAEPGPAVWLQPVKPCARCTMPDVDPQTAERGSAVGQLLHGYRQDRRLMGAVTFGMNAIVRRGDGQLLHEGMAGHGTWGAW